ncbi:hypothetical protein D3C80_1867000 [compost metagenome]
MKRNQSFRQMRQTISFVVQNEGYKRIQIHTPVSQSFLNRCRKLIEKSKILNVR